MVITIKMMVVKFLSLELVTVSEVKFMSLAITSCGVARDLVGGFGWRMTHKSLLIDT